MLRIEGSTKIKSDREKKCMHKNKNNIPINIDGLITNLNNTNLLNIQKYSNIQKSSKIQTKTIILKDININNKYSYTNDDIEYVKHNINTILFVIQKWHHKNANANLHNIKNIFTISSIINNMILLKRVIPFYCPYCKRIHENQHPYIFIINNNLFFHCRRSQKPLNISYLLKG